MTTSGPSGAERRTGLGPPLKAGLAAVIGIGILAILYVIVSALGKPAASRGLEGLNHGSMAKLQVLAEPLPEAAVSFTGADGRSVHLSDFKGRAVILNLWATWCAPCVKEMPTLAALQTADAAKPVKVVAVSMDTAGQTDKAKAFMAAHPPLPFYQDTRYAFMTGMKPQLIGFPTTVLIDREGMERATYAGDTDWSSPEARAVVDRLAGL